MFLVDPGGAQVQELVELQSFAHLGYGKSKVVAAVAWRPQVEGEVKKKEWAARLPQMIATAKAQHIIYASSSQTCMRSLFLHIDGLSRSEAKLL